LNIFFHPDQSILATINLASILIPKLQILNSRRGMFSKRKKKKRITEAKIFIMIVKGFAPQVKRMLFIIF